MITAVIAGTTLAAAAVTLAPSAQAVPGDPNPGCEPTLFANYCDGPVRADHTFKRCWTTQGSFGYTGGGGYGGGYIAPGQYCEMVDLTQPWPIVPIGAPQHHIDP